MTTDRLPALRSEDAAPTCCELACYEDPGCACDGCRSEDAAPQPDEGHDIRCVDCGQAIGPGMVPCLTPGAGLYDRPITRVTTPDGQVYRAHVPCCWCGDHHEEGR